MENRLLTKQQRTVLPDRQELRTLFDEEADAISLRNNLNTPWHRKLRDAVFEACYAALSDYRSRKRRLLTASAPCGAGKTSFALAFIVAMTRYADKHPEAPQGCVFVTDRIQRADEVYRDLEAALPGKVAIWTSEHKDLFSREVLRDTR
jgi:superfamily II DNA or RNA helicase